MILIGISAANRKGRRAAMIARRDRDSSVAGSD